MMRLVWCAVAALAASPAVAAAQAVSPQARPAEQRLTDAEGEIQELWQSYFNIVRDDLPNTKASLDCGTGRYEEVKATNSYLVFFVRCERLDAHANGYRAVIGIGNPHTFTFRLAGGTLSYGADITAALVKEAQRVPLSTGTDLVAGTWTRIEVPIAADSTDLAKIVVEFSTRAAIEGGLAAPSHSSGGSRYGLLAVRP